MGVQPTGMQGSVLTDAFVHPPATDTQKRDSEIKVLSPVVGSLIAQSSTSTPPATDG
jgi:hypothetical protein